MKISYNARCRLIGMFGNVLEHYDSALFGLLAPFLAPLFFAGSDPLTALILTYGMLPLGMIARPVGSLFFGWVGDRYGRRKALFYALIGMGFATVALGCLPTYEQVGLYAPLGLVMGKMAQSFCAAGELVGGAIFVLEHTESKEKSVMSSLYDVSTILGVILASGVIFLSTRWAEGSEMWRYLFWSGGICGLAAVFFRLKFQRQEGDNSFQKIQLSLFSVLKEHKTVLLSIIAVSGFSYVTYAFAFNLMNGYVPLVTSLSKEEVMGVNTYLLGADLLLLPIFGYVATKMGKERLMFVAALVSALCAVPLFMFLHSATLSIVIAIRFLFVVLGVAFAASYHAWGIERVDVKYRYTILSLGYAIGSQMIGAPTTSLCLWLYQKTEWVGAPALYLMGTALIAVGGIVLSRRPQATSVYTPSTSRAPIRIDSKPRG